MSNVKRKVNLDLALQAGNDSERTPELGHGITYREETNEDRTITTGNTHMAPRLNIDSADTYTVDAGASLISMVDLTVTGTLTVNGECFVIG